MDMPFRHALSRGTRLVEFLSCRCSRRAWPYVSVFLLTEAEWNQAQIGAVLTVSGLIGISLHIPIGACKKTPAVRHTIRTS